MKQLKHIWRTAKLFILGLLAGALLIALFLAPPLMRWIGANTGSARPEPQNPALETPAPVLALLRLAGAPAGAAVSADGLTWFAPAAAGTELALTPGEYAPQAARANQTVFISGWTVYQSGADTEVPVLDLERAPECPEFVILEKNYNENSAFVLAVSGAETATLVKAPPGMSVQADAGGVFRLETETPLRPGFYHAVLTAGAAGGEAVLHAGLRVRAGDAVTEIAAADDLRAMAYNLNGRFRLTEDIDLSGESWQPIGGEEHPFTGVFEGGGHEIRGLSAPLFGVVRNAEISGVALRDPAIAGGAEAAAIALIARDSFIRDAAVLGGSVRAAAAAAGGVCRAEGSVLSGLVNSAAVRTDGPAAARPRAGGLAAVAAGHSLIRAGANYGDIGGAYLAGGVVALSADSSVSRCFGGGSVRAPATPGLPAAGGVAHLVEWGRATDCYYLEGADGATAGAGNLSPAVIAGVTPLTAAQAQTAAALTRLGEFSGAAPEWVLRPEWPAGPLPAAVAAAMFPSAETDG